MKKKISILGLVLVLAFGFTGCSKSSDTTEYDEATMGQYADFIIQNFSAMGEDDFASFTDMSDLQLDLTMLQSGVPVSGENFLTMIDAWKAGMDECGMFVSHDDYVLETSNDGATLSADAVFEDRDGTIEFAFDEDMNMESLTVSAKYSTGEILEKAGLNTILGMGTVFVVLIFISFIISLFKFIPEIEKKFRKSSAAAGKSEAPKAAPVPEAAPAEPETDDEELVAVIAAAVAAAEGTSTDGFVVRSIKRRKSNKWN